MKVTKIFGCVLGLHICIIAVLLVQPGCQTAQPPTQTHTQDRAMKTTVMKPTVEGARRSSDELIPATRAGDGLDSAFNAGFDGDTSGLEPIDAIDPISPAPTVDVAGPSYQNYTVKKGDSLWGIAKRFNVSVNELYDANGLNKNSILRVGQLIQVPSDSSTATVSSVTPDSYQPSGYNQATTSYTVKAGDTLSRIANKYDTSVPALKAANGKTSDIIRVGEVLTVPVSNSSSNTSSTNTSATAPQPTTTTSTTTSGSTRTHTVKSGEYPGKIAKMYGMTTSELLAMNSISDPRKLRVGQKLKVSGSGSPANVDSRVETVVAPAPAQSTNVTPPQPTRSPEPVEIKVIEADPLVEGEFDEPEVQPESDDVFEDAIEIPVIRVEE